MRQTASCRWKTASIQGGESDTWPLSRDAEVNHCLWLARALVVLSVRGNGFFLAPLVREALIKNGLPLSRAGLRLTL